MTEHAILEHMWAAQDAFLTALGEQAALGDVAKGIGHPVTIEPDHVWITGRVSGKVDAELSGSTAPGDEEFRLTVVVYTQLADEYTVVRDRLKGFADAVGAAMASPGVAAIVPAWTIPDYQLDEGTDGTYRQLALELTFACQCW